VRQLAKAGCKKVFHEVASETKPDRAQLRRLLDQLEAGDVLTVTRLDRLARSTRDLLNTLAAITAKKAGFKSLGDTWADTTTSHGRLMLTGPSRTSMPFLIPISLHTCKPDGIFS
jgi:DNA invertase Pin-like site-specific DNA recombinase